MNKLETLKGGCNILDEEVHPAHEPVASSAEYRKYLTQALLYKVKTTYLHASAEKLPKVAAYL